MASDSKSEDEILGIDSSKDLGTDSSKIDDDISCIDEDMLLLNDSPAPSCPAAKASVSKSKTKTKKRKANSTPPKPKAAKKKTTLKSLCTLGSSDNDDELEIIEDDNEDIEELLPAASLLLLEEITEVNDVTVSSASDLEDEDEEEEEADDVDESLSGESEEDSEEDLGTFLDGKINIFHCHGSFFVWNADDALMLREECRILGKLTGSLPRAPRQNSHLGIPLQLMPEEVKLLVDIDAAVVVTEDPPSEKVLAIREAAFQNVRATNFKIQQQLFKETRQEDVKKRMNDIIAGKKAKKQKLKKDATSSEVPASTTDDKPDDKTAEEQKKPASSHDDNDQGTEGKDKENQKESDVGDKLTVNDIISETADTSEKHCLVQIFTENPWKRSIRPYLEWAYPSTEREMLRYYVFKDLWGKGFFLTSGVKFGGDFLVYPGDPARFHSHYIAICKNQAEGLPSLDIITYGRQASNVRKTALLCSLDRSKKVFYTSLQWTGMS